MQKRKVRASDILSDLRSGMTDQALMRKYALSSMQLDKVFAKLLKARLLTDAEIERRKNLQGESRTGKLPPLQSIIDGSKPHDLIDLPRGEYFGQVVVDKPLTIRGQGRKTWIGSLDAPTIKISSPGVVLQNLWVEITGSAQELVIEAMKGTNPLLENVVDIRATVAGAELTDAGDRGGSAPDTEPTITFTPPPPISSSPPTGSSDISSTASGTAAESMDSPLQRKIRSLFQEADSSEKKGDWKTAKEIYEDILSPAPSDRDAETLLERARRRSGIPTSTAGLKFPYSL
jgi:hypothetical protein